MKKRDMEKKIRFFNYMIEGAICAENLSQATDIIIEIANEKKDCFILKKISIQG